MTEPRVEAGDRALGLKIRQLCAAWLDRGDGLPGSDDIAALIQSAMNAQERELREALRRAMTRLRDNADWLEKVKDNDFPYEEKGEREASRKIAAAAERLLAERGEGR